MPRQSRKAQALNQAELQQQQQLAPSVIVEAPSSDRGEPPPTRRAPARRTRVTCPLCGFLPEAGRLEDSPFAVNVRWQYFGGSYPSTDKEYRRAYMRYVDADPETRLLAAQLMLRLLHAASVRIVSDLPVLYTQAGQDTPRRVQEQASPADILSVLPARSDLLVMLSSGDSRIAEREDWRGVSAGPRAQELDVRRLHHNEQLAQRQVTRQLRKKRRLEREEGAVKRAEAKQKREAQTEQKAAQKQKDAEQRQQQKQREEYERRRLKEEEATMALTVAKVLKIVEKAKKPGTK